MKRVLIIAEVKTQSPFGWKSDKSWDELFDIANQAGDVISVHTDARWGGSFELIRKARGLTSKPILAKGVHKTDDDVKEAIRSGADLVLVVGRVPSIHQDKCLIEPLTLADLKTIPNDLRVVWNSRDLSDGGMKKESFEQARRLFDGWLCQASNIKTTADIQAGADAVLIGTHLTEFSESLPDRIAE